MTMPHLMNCDHDEEGWCLSCVKQMHDELERERDEARTAARTIYLNLPPASISGNIVYDARDEERFIRDYVYERAKEFLARHDSSGIIWQTWHDRAEVQVIAHKAAERRKKLREQGRGGMRANQYGYPTYMSDRDVRIDQAREYVRMLTAEEITEELERQRKARMGLSQQQIEVRATGLGGSDAAAAVGLSRWKSRYQLWLEKTGHAEPFIGNDATHWGNMLEPIVRQEYANRTGLSIITPGETLKHPDFPFVLANIDGIVPDDRIVECKTGRPSNDWGEPGTSEIPEEYVLQVQHYLMVTQLPRADVPVLLGGNDFRIYHIEADGETQALLLQGEREFWELVQRNEPPEPETPEDIRRRWPKSQDKPRIASGYVADVCRQLREATARQKTWEEWLERTKADVQMYLGECDTLVDERGRKLATWKTAKGATRFDAKAFEQAHPELYREFCRPTEGSRRFLLKEIDE